MYIYDNAGNRTEKRTYSYTTGTPTGRPIIDVYSYTDSEWGDLLTAYQGGSNAITYDAIGNPVNIYGTTLTWQGRRLTSYTRGSNVYTYTYNADGIRTSKTVNGVTHNYVLEGSNILAETYGNTTLRFVYDNTGVIGLYYNNVLYMFEKNLQGDVVAILDSSLTRVVEYSYDAWGNMLSTSGSMASTLGAANPIRYRSYYYDAETGWYYLQSRYYNPVWGRFISSDELSVIEASPMALTDKNLYAYCDNNPVTRVDADGEFWLISVGVGLATQYVGDVIGNIIDGKTGIDIFERTSSIGEYIAAGVTALIPGSGLGSAIVRSVVTEGIKSIEETIQGEDDSAVESLINIGLGTAIDWGFGKALGKIDDFMKSKMPRNYSSYAHILRQSDPSLTRDEISLRLKRSINTNRKVFKGISIVFDIVKSALPN